MAKGKRKKIDMISPDLLQLKKGSPDHQHLFWQALHYAQYDMTDKALKKSMIHYAKENKLDHKLLNILNDKELALAGKYAFIIVGGGELPESVEQSFAQYIDELFVRARAVRVERKAELKAKKKESAAPQLTVQDRMRMQAEEVGAVFDQWLDDLILGKIKKATKDMDPTKLMQQAGFKAGQARWLKKFYKAEQKELKAVVAGKDPEVKEGYSNIKTADAKRALKMIENILSAAYVIETMSKAKRKTRKKKAPSITKQISKLKYCEAHSEYGVASVSPAGILGAKELWVFNTKYRKLGRYVANDAGGLTVKGASITDFDETKSVQKTLRKPADQLKDFMSAGKVKLRTFLDDIKAVDTKLNGRMNNNIVILKVFK